MPALTRSQAQLVNQTFLDQLNDRGMEKQAVDAVNDFTRTRVREDGFSRRLMPPLTLGNDELDRQYHTDKPFKIIDKEPDIPPAISVPFGALPINHYIRGPRYAVGFDRILSPQFIKDQSELRTWHMDIRQVMADNAIKDMLAEEDSKFIAAVNTSVGLVGSIVPTSGVVQHSNIPGGVTRDSWQDALSIMPSTPFHLEVHTALINNVTIRQFLKWGRDEVGGDMSQDLLRNGWTEREFGNVRVIITIKRDLVPDNTVFMFADPKFIGKTFELEPITTYIERRYWWLSYFMWEELGASIGHTGGLARANFT